MLRKCAPGHELVEKTHLHWIWFEGKRATLPQGKHGRKNNAEIEIGHIRNMVRQLGLDEDCVKKHLPQLS